MAEEVTELAGYRIESQLGRGGMGVVYRAHDLALDRKVALKLLAPELAGDVRFRERFLRESRLAASLDHPAIIPIYDAGEVAGQLYIAMRLVEGADLKRLLADEGVMEPEQALKLLEQVADALDVAHERGLVHRDVKPSNVLVDERGHCYLADFGLSRRLADTQAGVGGGGSLGTVDYVAPEQIRGEQIDGRADLYSLGCLLYECLSGRPPYVRGSDTATVFAHLEEDAPGLPGLDSVIRKALAKEPDDRYQSGRELIAAARHALRAERRPGHRRLLAAAVVLAAVGAATVGVLALRGTHGQPQQPARPQAIPLQANTLNLIDARTRRVVNRAGAGSHEHLTHGATDVAFLGRSAWFSIAEERRLVRFDLAKGRVTAVVKLPWEPTERIAAGGGIVWLREARNLGTAVLGIDARSGRVVRRFPDRGGSSVGIAYGDGSLWLVGGGEVIRVNPRNGRIVHHFPASADWLVVGDGAVWAASTDGSVWKIDPIANAISARAKLHGWLSDLAVGAGSVWVSIVGENAVYRLSNDDLSEQRAIPSGPDPERISVGGGFAWVANTQARMLTLLANETGARKQFATETNPTTAEFHDGLVWIAAERGLAPLPPISGTELRVAARLFNVDPVSRVFPMDEQLSNATCANLLDYTDSAVPGGARLRPEIAAAMPQLSAGGRSYTFHIRSGFRFSPPSNEPVTAETFRHTIERTLYKTAQGWPDHYLPDIVGATAYSAGKVTQISGIKARGDLLRITLVRPAGDFLTRLSMPVFCPVPLATPLDAKGTAQPIPSTGPYYIASIADHRTVLLRNPNYPGSRPRNAERIVITDDIPTPKAVALANNGQLDYVPTDFSSPQLGIGGPLDQRFGPDSASARTGRQRFFRHMQPMVDLIVFNTRRPLFHDVALRRAVGYALDRTALAKAYFDVPDARVIPAAIPAYDRGRIYPLVPHLSTARLLAAKKGRHAILLAPCIPQSVPALVRSELAKIGIVVSIVLSQACHPRDVAQAFKHADLLIGGSLQCGPCNRDPAQFFQDVLDHGVDGSPLSLGGWNERGLRRDLARAAPLRGKPRVGAYTRLDDRLARAAPFLVYGAFQYAEYFSARIGCKIFPPYSQGVELGTLCVRK